MTEPTVPVRNRRHNQERHGMTGTPEYFAWNNMLMRCLLEDRKDAHRYKDHGVTVCERWLSFANFFADMGRKPSPKHKIDRIDNNGNYEPSNCRWATKQEQCRNRSTTRNLTFQGKTMCIREWSKVTGIKRQTIQQRLKNGWSVEDTLTKPAHHVSVP
jgi:hypothetical protein